MATLTCTPSELLDTYKCLQCLSETELKAVIVIALATQLGETVAETLTNSSCYTCMSKKQLLQAAAAVMGNQYLSDSTVAEIRDDIKCLVCGPAGTMEAALLYQLCALYNRQN